MSNLLPFALAWVVLLIVVVLLGFKRKNVAAQEDDTIHLGGGSDTAIERQKATAKQLEKLDKWGKNLTIVMAVSGVVLAILYVVQMWKDSATAGM
ncbi:MAG TPA: hypothetical protein PKJ41_07160 [Bryobacteraceae bacterium]|nr:hypothetical protein [Bryobacteraceae bacterium]HPT26154.1 hypothetical protein [Bryobacteraceae bacterium]